jgi:hypothetical protein
MFPLRRSLMCPVAGALLFVAGVAGAQTTTFSPSVIGKSIELEGQLEVLVEDYADGHAVVRHFLKTSHDRIELKFERKAPQLPHGTRVRVQGHAQDSVLTLDGSAGSLQPLNTVLPSTMGEQSVAVMLVNFQDDTSQPKTIAQAQDLVLGEVSNHYRESSFGQTSFKGKAFGWYTVAMSKNACDPTTLAKLADAQATAAGVNLAEYPRRVYMFPATSCQWLGLGTLGGASSQAWINGRMDLWVVGHEMGHNYGLHHAHSLDCDATVLGYDYQCDRYTYGDAADIMGNNRAGQFSPYQKERLGWLNDGISPPITTVASSGRYSIEPYSASTAGAKALKIPRGTDGSGHKLWFYIEYRQPIGMDSVLADAGNLTRGVMLRIATEGDGESMFQLDMTPGSSNQYFDEMADGALEVGKSFYDGDTGITIALASADGARADIDVTFGAPTCTRGVPYVYLTPTANAAVPAGGTVPFRMEVTNYDSVACPATTFTLANSVPAGWTSTFNTPTLTIKPGVTALATFDVTSAATAALGQYKIGGSVVSPVGALHTASALQVYYSVVTPCTPAAPLVSLTRGGTAVRAGTRVSYTLTVTNRDDSYCAPTTFDLARSIPDGWTGTLLSNSLRLAAGQTASTTLDVTSLTNAAIGSYGIGIATTSERGALHTVSAGSTYDVASSCTRAAPTLTLAGGDGVVNAGAAVGYALNLTNNDSTACSSTTFALARSVPTGWAGTLAKPSVAMAPGTTQSVALNVTSPATTAGGTYGIGVAASSPLGAVHTTSASSTYNVAQKLSIGDASIVEGQVGTTMAKFTVSLAKPTTVPVTFDIAAKNGTAMAGSDYTATNRTGLTIPAGSTSVVVSVPVIGDAVIEGNETFQVVVANVVGATVADGTATGTIRNDDTSLSIGDVSIVEGNTGTRVATFTVKLSNVSATPVTFGVSTSNKTAIAGTDYVALALTAQSIPAGSTSKVFNVAIKVDTLREVNETFLVHVGNLVGAVAGDAHAVGTIVNDD